MTERIQLNAWTDMGEKVQLGYTDGTILYVWKTDFNRAFGAIISASKEEVIRDFAIKQ